MDTHNSHSEEAEMGASLELASHCQTSLTRHPQASDRSHVTKWDRKNLRKDAEYQLWPPHPCMYAYTHMNSFTNEHTCN